MRRRGRTTTDALLRCDGGLSSNEGGSTNSGSVRKTLRMLPPPPMSGCKTLVGDVWSTALVVLRGLVWRTGVLGDKGFLGWCTGVTLRDDKYAARSPAGLRRRTVFLERRSDKQGDDDGEEETGT